VLNSKIPHQTKPKGNSIKPKKCQPVVAVVVVAAIVFAFQVASVSPSQVVVAVGLTVVAVVASEIVVAFAVVEQVLAGDADTPAADGETPVGSDFADNGL